MSRWQLGALALIAGLWASPAHAQLARGTFRLSIDDDMLSVAGVKVDPDGPVGPSKTTVFGLGPNQLGAGHVSASLVDGMPTPFGLGFAWGLSPKLLLGVRAAFGLDLIAPSGTADNIRELGLSLMPGLTFVPVGHKAKLFLSGAPLFQADRWKQGPRDGRVLLGGFELGIGTLIFVARSLSVDLGFHFEGRFGNAEDENGNGAHIRDLRGLVRLGISLWM